MNKKLFFTLISLLVFSVIKTQGQESVLMKINDRPVTKAEFEYLYNKNNTSVQQSVGDYLKLFIDYKLKVEEAINQGLDKNKEFLTEYNTYKNQITQPYLLDTISEQVVARKEYDRLGENLEVSHILIRFPQKGLLPKDTVEFYEKALTIRGMLVGNKAQAFETVAKEHSEDPSAKMSERAGYLGWATAMAYVSPFENAMYSMQPGEISMPVRSTFGYHIIKLHNKKTDAGKVKVAHIMFSYPQRDATTAQKDSVKKVAEDVYKKLQNGGSYAELCKEYSSDEASAVRDGSLGWIRVGYGLPAEFMEASFALKDTGDISKPITTSYGYHIIKLEDRAPRDSWEEAKTQIINQVKRGDLAEEVKKIEMQKFARANSYKVNKESCDMVVSLANSYLPNDSVYLSTLSAYDKELLSVKDKKYSVKDLAQYIPTANYRYNVSTDFITHAIDGFVYDKLKEAYISSLEDRYPEYKNLLKEYHDGILLFNVMNAQVWENAANDTLGLTDYFKKNKKNYKWDSPRYKGNIVYCKDEATMDKAQKLAQKYKNADLNGYLKSQLNNDSLSVVFARKGVWAKGDNKFVDNAAFGSDEAPEPMKDYPFYFVTGKTISAPEEYLDVKGLVISDLQEQKEKEWIEALRKKYPVEINEVVLKSVK